MPAWDSLIRSFPGALPHLAWRNFADILLVAVFLYQLLRLVRGTRAGQMLYGLLLLVLAFYAARWWELPTLDRLLTILLPYFGFAVIVLFQSEIRRGLAELGGVSFLWRFSGLRRASPYEDVVLAVSRISQEKIGALIVLERRTGLRTHIESGVALDARLSYDLLVTIFRPGAPLHDGAAIIQKEKLAAAACFLPLSVNPERPRELGSRHRAALGISEDTDAVAVVVAEHTGVISLAVEGAIEQGLTEERLRERLSDLFGKRGTQPAQGAGRPPASAAGAGLAVPGAMAAKQTGLGVAVGRASSRPRVREN